MDLSGYPSVSLCSLVLCFPQAKKLIGHVILASLLAACPLEYCSLVVLLATCLLCKLYVYI